MIKKYGIQKHEDIKLVKIRFILIHILALGIFFVPVNYEIILFSILIYFVRVFAWEGGSHRYFAHRSYKTSRVFQFILAFIAATGGQRGPIWWATKHKIHHQYSDEKKDPHSPVQYGWKFAHFGWLVEEKFLETNLDESKDLAKFKELVFINGYHYIFPYFGFIMIYLFGEYSGVLGEDMGLSALFFSAVLTLVLSLHSAFMLNSMTHNIKPNILNRRRYESKDTSTNAWWLALITMGGSWHNNHHHYQHSAKAGFYWWEIDLVFYILKILSFFHIVWDLKDVPQNILDKKYPDHSRKGSVDV